MNHGIEYDLLSFSSPFSIIFEKPSTVSHIFASLTDFNPVIIYPICHSEIFLSF